MPRTAYCTSDLHLHDSIVDGTLFTRDKERAFAALCERVLADDGALYLLGDVLDLTGAVRPRRGLEDFFEAVYPGGRAQAATDGLLPDVRERPVGERIAAMQQAFPRFFAALGSLARDGRLRMVPGNHDWELFTVAGRAAFDAAIGGGGARIDVARWFRVGERWLLGAHGHELDDSNRTSLDFTDPDGWRNPGATVTSVLYHAVMPALGRVGVPLARVAEIPAVRPEEEIVAGLQDILLPGTMHEWCAALGELLVANGYPVRYWSFVKYVVSPLLLRQALADDSAIERTLADAASAMIAGRADPYATGDAPSVVVMGHTHGLDVSQPRYVNLGTWIDGLRRLGGERDERLPFVRVDLDGDTAALYDAREWLADPSVRPLWSA